MNNRALILKETDTETTIFWKKNLLTNAYILVGINNLHNYEKILITNDNKIKIKNELLKNYRSFEVRYLLSNDEASKDEVVTSTKSLETENKEMEEITVKCIPSYRGLTLSFTSLKLFDKYCIYEKNNNKLEYIMETEDFQISSEKIKENHTYYVEGYVKNNQAYQLTGTTKEFVCKPETLTFGEKKLLSIVIPVYNAEIFLARCLDSILLATIKDIEIILVNDGSKDNSQDVIEWYQKQYHDIIKVYNQDNKGVSYARNKGIELASGEYLAFIDSDDMIYPTMYEELMNVIKKENLDIAIGRTIIRTNFNQYHLCLDVIPKENTYLVYDYEEMLQKKDRNSPDNIYFVAVWNKIIKTSLVKKHPFPLDNYYEDYAFTKNIYSYIDRFGFTPYALYVYDKRFRKTVGTLSTNYDKGHKNDPLFLHKSYANAISYAIDNGNQERIQAIAYDCVKDIINFIKTNIKSDNAKKIYKDKIMQINQKTNLLENQYIKNDEKIYQLMKELLSKEK